MVNIKLQMENVLKISNTKQALSKSLRTQVNGLTGEKRPIIQPQIEVLDLTKQQCDEARDVVPEGIWNLAYWGCRDTGQSLFMCPLLKTV